MRTLSVRALTSKSNWVGNDLTVARRFQLLANNWAENTKHIDFQIRRQLVRATANSFHPLLVPKCDKKCLSPRQRSRKQFWNNMIVTGLICLGFDICLLYWFNVSLTAGLTVYGNQWQMFKVRRQTKQKVAFITFYSGLFQTLLDAFQSLLSSRELERMAVASNEFVVLLRHLNFLHF